MGIKVTCQDCSRVYNFKNDLRGKKGRCRDCNALMVIDDVDNLDDLIEEEEEESFELPPRVVGKRRRKQREGFDLQRFFDSLTGNEALLRILCAIFGTARGQIAAGLVIGYLLMAMAGGGWFGRAGYFVHMSVAFAGIGLIAISFMGGIIDACKANPTNLLVVPIVNPVSVFLYIIFSPDSANTRHLLLVGICWTVCLPAVGNSLMPKAGFQQYRQDALDWWQGRPAAPQMAPAQPIPQQPAWTPPAAAEPAAPAPEASPQQIPQTAQFNPRPNAPGSGRRGQMILSTNLVSYRGTVDATTAARVALRPLGWIDADNVEVNLQDKKIIMPCLGGSIAGGEARRALEQAGFEVQGQSMRTVQ